MPPTDAPLRLMSPGQLLAHPDNWKTHPEAQLAALAESVERHGWLKTILWNEATGRVLNGEGRVLMAMREGLPQVPVWVVNLPEAAERDILLEFDFIGSMRERDDLALLSLVARVVEETDALPVGFTTDALAALADAVKAANAVPAPDTAPAPELSPYQPLGFSLTAADYTVFQERVDLLMARWETSGMGQTVLLALAKVAAERLGEA